MKLQDSAAGCGPAAMSNALEAMGVERSLGECEVLTGTTGEGCGPAQLLRALRAVEGVDPVILREAREVVALLRLVSALRGGYPVVLAADPTEQCQGGSHWIAAVGMLGDRVLVADSAETYTVTSYTQKDLAARWRCRGRKPYWGIIL